MCHKHHLCFLAVCLAALLLRTGLSDPVTERAPGDQCAALTVSLHFGEEYKLTDINSRHQSCSI